MTRCRGYLCNKAVCRVAVCSLSQKHFAVTSSTALMGKCYLCSCLDSDGSPCRGLAACWPTDADRAFLEDDRAIIRVSPHYGTIGIIEQFLFRATFEVFGRRDWW